MLAAGILLIYLASYFGAYLPLKKAVLYAKGRAFWTQAKTLQEFDAHFEPAFSIYTFTNEGEMVADYLYVLTVIAEPENRKEVIEPLIERAEFHAAPLIESGEGPQVARIMYELGIIYQMAAIKFEDRSYYEKSKAILERGLTYAPNHPDFLYTLFELYRNSGEVENAREIGNTILAFWPNDERVREFVEGK